MFAYRMRGNISPHLPYRGAGDDFSQNSQKFLPIICD
jgi:hypothetical protein